MQVSTCPTEIQSDEEEPISLLLRGENQLVRPSPPLHVLYCSLWWKILFLLYRTNHHLPKITLLIFILSINFINQYSPNA